MNPERDNQNHWYGVASNGRINPRVTHAPIPNNMIADMSRMIFTANEPILLPAFSKNKALIVQHIATPSAEISPVYTVFYFFIYEMYETYHFTKFLIPSLTPVDGL